MKDQLALSLQLKEKYILLSCFKHLLFINFSNPKNNCSITEIYSGNTYLHLMYCSLVGFHLLLDTVLQTENFPLVISWEKASGLRVLLVLNLFRLTTDAADNFLMQFTQLNIMRIWSGIALCYCVQKGLELYFGKSV